MNIRELAAEAGFSDADDKGVWITDGLWDKELTRFAALVAAHEREECAMLCDRFQERGMQPAECSEAIRARGTR